MGFMSPDAGGGAMPTPTAPKPPRPQAPIQGQRPGRKSMQQTFLGEGAVPQAPQAPGTKTLLGQ